MSPLDTLLMVISVSQILMGLLWYYMDKRITRMNQRFDTAEKFMKLQMEFNTLIEQRVKLCKIN